VPVNRGPSFADCSTAIAAAVVADIVAREQREEAARRRSQEVSRAVMRRPLSVAWIDPHDGQRPPD
jgi:hypothetical protein